MTRVIELRQFHVYVILWAIPIIFHLNCLLMFQSIASMLERVSKAIIFHSNNPNWFFHASAELGCLGGKNRWWRWQLSEPLIEQSTLLNFYLPPTDSTLGLRGSRDDKGRMVGKPTRERAPSCFLLSGERGALTTSISFSFQPTNGKIMLQIAIRLFFISSNLIESFFTSRTSPHCRSRPNSILWPSLEQCVSRSISSVINQTYREISTCWQKLFTHSTTDDDDDESRMRQMSAEENESKQ